MIEDNSARGKSSFTFDARVGWKFRNVQLAVDVLNLFDKKTTTSPTSTPHAFLVSPLRASMIFTFIRPNRARFVSPSRIDFEEAKRYGVNISADAARSSPELCTVLRERF